ncbi:MAG TPA: hypothetical protein VFC10_01695 [Terriglobia bacterium]|nr:hypothetical protein [Terriglobia bacterium]
MKKVQYVCGLALLVAASLTLLPVLEAADNPAPDSPEVSELLSQAKSHANQLRNDADTMKSFSAGKLSWQSHAERIRMIKDHTNDLGKVLQEMSDKRQSASPWQQAAIDRITPLARELAANIETTIEHINNNRDQLHTPRYREYLSANFEVTSSLAKLINDLVEYGQNKAKYESLGKALEVPGM